MFPPGDDEIVHQGVALRQVLDAYDVDLGFELDGIEHFGIEIMALECDGLVLRLSVLCVDGWSKGMIFTHIANNLQQSIRPCSPPVERQASGAPILPGLDDSFRCRLRERASCAQIAAQELIRFSDLSPLASLLRVLPGATTALSPRCEGHRALLSRGWLVCVGAGVVLGAKRSGRSRKPSANARPL